MTRKTKRTAVVDRKATLPKLSRAERTANNARVTWMDESIPAPALAILAKLGITEQDALDRIGRTLADYRSARQYEAARLIPQERREQAQAAAAVILDLIERIPCLDPEITARMSAQRFTTHGDGFGHLWDGQALPALAEIHSLLTRAAWEIDHATPPPKRGRKRAPVANPVFLAALEVIEAHAGLGTTAARKAAQEIAAKCGINLSASTRTLQRKAAKNSQ